VVRSGHGAYGGVHIDLRSGKWEVNARVAVDRHRTHQHPLMTLSYPLWESHSPLLGLSRYLPMRLGQPGRQVGSGMTGWCQRVD
jgi:hypothetical protein